MNIEDIIKRGKKHYIDGNLQEAKGCFLSIIQINPYHLEALNNLAVILFYEGQNDLAQDIFKKILSIDPAYKDGLLNLYDLLNNYGNISHFIPYMEMAMATAPKDQELEIFLKDIKKQVCHEENRGVPSAVLNAESFFVLSSGRCGSKTLNEVLNTAENVRSFHTSQPDMGQGALDAFWNRIEKKVFLSNYHYPLIQQTSKEGFVFGETTPAITAFSDVLAETIPKAKFVILVRNPLTFTRSALFQNYYHGHADDTYRFTPLKDTDAYVQWKKKSQVEKICWLWNEFYNLIERATENLDQDRFMVLRFEDLFSSIQTPRRLFDFLNLKGFSASRVSEILKVKRNANNYGRFPTVRDWSPEFKRNIEQASMKYALKYGYKKADPVGIGKGSKKPDVHVKKSATVTIGLPVYNGGKYLAEAIESILLQDFKEFELIISDNNSNDQTRDICDNYRKRDKRITYIHLRENIGARQNFLNVLDLTRTPYFMWASHDDLREKSLISKCLEAMQADSSIALVYPKTKMLDSNSNFIEIAKDYIKADQDNPTERFLHIIWELGVCNMFHGLLRSDLAKKVVSWKQTLFFDNLFLAEMALAGKIVQIHEPLFIRRLTRDYNYKSPDDRNEQLISVVDQSLFNQGISLPHCRLTYAHLDLVHNSDFKAMQKNILIQEILKCFKTRFGNNMKYEIDRAVTLILKGIYYWTWRNDQSEAASFKQITTLGYYRISNLLKTLQEALLIYPERTDLYQCYIKCLKSLNSPDNTFNATGE